MFPINYYGTTCLQAPIKERGADERDDDEDTDSDVFFHFVNDHESRLRSTKTVSKLMLLW